MVTAKTQDKNKELIELDRKFVNPVLARQAPIVAERGEGSYLYDVNGDKYLDFTTGIAVNNIGHCHPKVVEAVREQVGKLMHTSVCTHHTGYIELCQKIASLMPGDLDSVFLANSGAECVEGAVKLARYVTGRPAVVTFRGGFHGRTHLCMSLTTSKLTYRDMYEPLQPAIFTVPFPYVFRSDFPNDPKKVLENCLHEIEMLFLQIVNPKQVAAFIVEPILGEGGYVVPPEGFFKALRKICDEHGIMLIMDEVQTGFGRTGKMFATEWEGVVPDILTMAKGIAAGMPLSGFASRKELTSKWDAGRHGTTFGGNPVSCAAALASIKVIEEEKLCDRAHKVGTDIMNRLKKLAETHKQIGDVRGRGMMIGIEFNDEHGHPSKEWSEKVAKKCFDNKLLVLTCGYKGQVIRLIPPLNASDREVDEALKIIENAISEK
jgi:4-aminobutyrate aminotransferase